MTEHITSSQWIRFFSGEAAEPEKLLILRHAAECEECHSLMDKANDLRFALERQFQADQPGFESEEDAYRAVAGLHPVSPESDRSGSLSVELELSETGWLFLEDTLHASGIGQMFAMNCSADCRDLTDDGDALSVLVRDNELTVKAKETGIHGFVRLYAGQQEATRLLTASEIRLALPRSGHCELEIVFEEE